MRNLKIKSLAIACSGAVFLIGCSGSSGGNPNNSVASGSNTPSTPAKAPLKAVRIGSFGIVPTAGGTSGAHYLKVDNSTDSTLTLDNFQTTDAANRGFISKTVNAVNKFVGGKGYDPRIEAAGCSTLQPGGSCLIGINPDATDGSFGLQLNYSDLHGVNYKAAQLIEYSSVVQDSDGFLVFNGSTPRISSDDRYSVAIPFVANNDYTKIELASRINPISSSLDCSTGANKGQHCTAILTMPAGNYSNTVTVKGTTADGKVHSFTAVTSSDTNNIANLIISKGPIIIDARTGNSTTGTLDIVNNSASSATAVIAELNNKQIDGVGEVTITGYDCTGINGTQAILPTTLPAAAMCTATFTSDGKSTGVDSYKVAYQGGAAGFSYTSALSNIFWLGVNKDTVSTFKLLGQPDYTNTVVGSSRVSNLTVLNNGKIALKNITATLTFANDPISELSLTPAGTCRDYAGDKQLASGESCTFTLVYAPTKAKTALDEAMVRVTAKAANDSVNPTSQPVSFYLSAIDSGDSILFKPYPHIGIGIFANGSDSLRYEMKIQNASADKTFTLSSIKATGWPDDLKMVESAGNASCHLAGANGESQPNNFTLKSYESCSLYYTYGSTTKAESGNARQEFIGKFNGTLDYSTMLTTQFQADKDNIIKVDPGTVTTEKGNQTYDPVTGITTFELVKTNIAQVVFTYTGKADYFLVNDSDIPYGFMVDTNTANTTCKTTSMGNQKGGALVGTCKVTYNYMDNRLSDSLFYSSVATNNMIPVYPPSYQISDTTGKSIHTVVPDHATTETRITANSFTTITSSEGIANAFGSNIHRILTFKLGSYDGSRLLSNANVIIQPDWDQDTLVTPMNSGSCTISSPKTGASCTIEVSIAPHPAQSAPKIDLNFIASSSIDPDYNAIKSYVSLDVK